INGGAPLTVSSAGTSDTATINASTAVDGTFVYDLVSVESTASIPCISPETGSVTIEVGPLPVASISGDATICEGETSVISFTGTPGSVVTYTIDGGANLTVTLDAAGNASVTTPTLLNTTVYSLVSVADSSGSCSQPQAGSATVTVNPVATAT